MTAPRGHGIDGIIVLAKPPGPTSHDMVATVRRLTGTRRVGHGGTLDPFAAGVLPVFLGLGTRIVEYHMGDSKAYRATICFGASSTTDDRDGELVPGPGPAPNREQLEQALAAFRGQIEQRPPAYSALKVGGRRAYQLAREGHPPELALRQVTIQRLTLVEWQAEDPQRPVAIVEVECSAGTYIRALARDLGERLGCGAYLGALVRTASGPFRLKGAHELDELRAAAAGGPARLARLVLPIDAGLEEIPSLALSAAELEAVSRGQQVRPTRRPQLAQETTIRLLGPDESLVGMGVWRAGRIVPEKVFVAPPVRAAVGPSGDGDETAAAGAGGLGTAGDGAAASPGPLAIPGALVSGPGSGARPPREPRLRLQLPEICVAMVPGIAALEPSLGRLYVAVGVFDGLHRGHLYLLRHLRRAARRAGARPAVITFDAHPAEIIRGSAPPLLCDPGERLVRLAAAGVQVTVVQHFDASLRTTEYDGFVAMLQERVEIAGFLMTPEAAFGYERRGTPEALAALGEREGFEVTVVPPLLLDGAPVRSSEIRRDVAEGRLRAARRRLGRALSVTGSLLPAAGAGESSVPGAAAPVRFSLPVALPPAGRYPVLLGSAWLPGAPPEPASRPGWATVAGGELALETSETDPLPAAADPPDGADQPADTSDGNGLGRVRVVFVAGPQSRDAAERATSPAAEDAPA